LFKVVHTLARRLLSSLQSGMVSHHKPSRTNTPASWASRHISSTFCWSNPASKILSSCSRPSSRRTLMLLAAWCDRVRSTDKGTEAVMCLTASVPEVAVEPVMPYTPYFAKLSEDEDAPAKGHTSSIISACRSKAKRVLAEHVVGDWLNERKIHHQDDPLGQHLDLRSPTPGSGLDPDRGRPVRPGDSIHFGGCRAVKPRATVPIAVLAGGAAKRILPSDAATASACACRIRTDEREIIQ
jgi:hypothetical protein